MRRALVYFQDRLAGVLVDADDHFEFAYDAEYRKDGFPLSVTLPLREEPFRSHTLHPFFDGLIVEGWLLKTAEENWKIDPNDRMALLLLTGQDTVGAVSIVEDPSHGQ